MTHALGRAPSPRSGGRHLRLAFRCSITRPFCPCRVPYCRPLRLAVSGIARSGSASIPRFGRSSRSGWFSDGFAQLGTARRIHLSLAAASWGRRFSIRIACAVTSARSRAAQALRVAMVAPPVRATLATGSAGSAVASSSVVAVYPAESLVGILRPIQDNEYPAFSGRHWSRADGDTMAYHPPVDPLEQHLELRRRQRHLALLGRGPDEAAAFQPLGELPLERHCSEQIDDSGTLAVPPDQVDQVAATAAEERDPVRSAYTPTVPEQWSSEVASNGSCFSVVAACAASVAKPRHMSGEPAASQTSVFGGTGITR